jgi:hypothetical protein
MNESACCQRNFDRACSIGNEAASVKMFIALFAQEWPVTNVDAFMLSDAI